jgi:hypothetical protein
MMAECSPFAWSAVKRFPVSRGLQADGGAPQAARGSFPDTAVARPFRVVGVDECRHEHCSWLAVVRARILETGVTERRHVDIAAAFADEKPTAPRHQEARALAQRPEATGRPRRRAAARDPDGSCVAALVPLDVVPVLAVPRTEIPWDDLGKLATQLLLRLDGTSHTMAIVTGICATPNEGVRELAALVRRGLVRLETPPAAIDSHGSPLDLDLSQV